jgi:gluconokinase
MSTSLVIMGVAGCGKSSLGRALADALKLPLVEGDDFHSPASREKMSRGVALDDADRAGWLDTLGLQLAAQRAGVVLTCSSLKRAYRERLRTACPDLRFVFLDIDRDEALRRVAQRAAEHFFSASLVDSQFATLESPVGEAGVLRLDARSALDAMTSDVLAWLNRKESA